MLTLLATASDSDVNTLFLILAFACFLAGLWLVVARREMWGGVAAAIIGVLILLFAL